MSSSYEMINKEFDYQLFECSILIISLLLNQYKAKSINIIDFKCHTANKINYILNNFDVIKDEKEKTNIKNLINECNAISNGL